MVRRVATGMDALGAGLGASGGPLDASGVVATGESDLALLRQGKITESEYVDRLVLAATRHLEGAVSDERLAAMRSVVRAQFLAAEELDADSTDAGSTGAGSTDPSRAARAATEPALGALLRRITA